LRHCWTAEQQTNHHIIEALLNCYSALIDPQHARQICVAWGCWVAALLTEQKPHHSMQPRTGKKLQHTHQSTTQQTHTKVHGAQCSFNIMLKNEAQNNLQKPQQDK
jgi:hypothetical protein